MYDKIEYRYSKGYITNEQLLRYVKLEVITMDEARLIIAKYGGDSDGK